MGLMHRIVYGPGGYDPAKPNNNVVLEDDVPTPPEQDNQEAMISAAQTALASLRAYRDLQSPTNAQTVAVVRLLCTCMIQVIRLLVLRQLDGTD